MLNGDSFLGEKMVFQLNTLGQMVEKEEKS